MQLTNKFNLPQTFVNVIQRPTYTKGNAHISATELINSPRIVQLKQKHWDDLEQDASEMVWALFGTSVHGLLERFSSESELVEERIQIELDGQVISGQPDILAIDSGEIGRAHV